jgi:hypothetical protein
MVDLAGLGWTWLELGWGHLQFRESVNPVETRLEPAQDWFDLPKTGVPVKANLPDLTPFVHSPIFGTQVFAIEVSVCSNVSCVHCFPFAVV